MGQSVRNRSNKSALFAVASVLAMGSPLLAYAQTEAEQEAKSIALSEGPLGDRVLKLSEILGENIFAPGALVAGKRSNALSGTYSAEEALSVLLSGTGLIASPGPTGGFILSERQSETDQRSSIQTTTTPVFEEAELASIQEVIIVRGERVPRTEFETPSSVSVFTGDDIENNPFLQDSDDLLSRIPNIVTAGTTAVQASVRGVDSTGSLVGRFAFAGGSIPRVTTLVDGYPLSFNEYLFGPTSVYDIDQVEIYRGPQTTTQGANAIAGAIFVFTNDPTYEFEGGALVEAGNYNTLQVAGHVSGPIVEDQLAGRISVDFRQRDSFVEFPGVSEIDGYEVDRFESLNIRGKLLWEPSAVPDLSAKLTVFHNDGESPSTEAVIEPLEDFISDRTLRNNPIVNTVASTGGILDLSYALSDDWTITNQLSYSDYEYVTAIPTRADGETRSIATEGTNLTNETVLTYAPIEGRISGVAGVYYTTRDQDDLVLILGEELTVDKRNSLGVFAEATAELTDRLEFTAGVRYQRDEQDRDGLIFRTPIDFDESFNAVLPKAALAYDVNDSLRIGVSASRGYNPGGVNTQLFTGITTPFGEETVWTYDAFLRANSLDGRLKINANIFFSDFDDYQRVAVLDIIPAVPIDNIITDITNVDGAKTYGFEASGEFEVNDAVNIYGSLGLLDTRFDELIAPGEFGEFEFARAPNVSLTAGIDVTPVENLYLSGQVRHTDKFFSSDQNLPAEEIDSSTIIDLSARYTFENFEVYGYVENVADELVLLRRFSAGAQPTAIPSRPRTFGVGARVSF